MIKIQQKQKDGSSGGGGLGQLLGMVGGGVAGAAIGGPAGALTGVGLGGQIGGTVGGMAAPGEAPQEAAQVSMSDGAMQRRAEQAESANRIKQLREAAINLPNVDVATRDQATSPILTAYMQETQRMRG